MDTSVQLFSFQQHPVRVTMIDGTPWWVASDVCKVLELGNVSKAMQGLDDDEKKANRNSEGKRLLGKQEA